MKKTVIFDLDGTLALIDSRREISIIDNDKLDWDTFFNPKMISLDDPNIPVIKIAQMFHINGFRVVIFSGRNDRSFHTTKSWLTRNKVPFHKLVMRPHKTMNFVPDEVLKKDMLDKHLDINDIFMVVDDRQKVVDMWRSLGLICLQAAEGNF